MNEKHPTKICVTYLEGGLPCQDCMDLQDEINYWYMCYNANHQNPNACPTYYNGCNCGGAMTEEIFSLEKKRVLLAEAIDSFIEVAQLAINSKRNKGGQQVPYHGDFASVPPSTVRDLEHWVNRFKAALNAPKCQCQWEAGDSPCPIHGE